MFKSVVAKYLLETATSSNLLSRSRNKHAAAAILLASVVRTRLSVGSGIVNLMFKLANCFANCQLVSSIGPHEKTFFLRRKFTSKKLYYEEEEEVKRV